MNIGYRYYQAGSSHVDYDQICRIAYLAWGGFSKESFEKYSSIELLNLSFIPLYSSSLNVFKYFNSIKFKLI